MLPEETEVSLIEGRSIVEVGCRQVWPFLGLLDQSGDREIRLYIDTRVEIDGDDGGVFDQEDAELLAARGRLLNCSVETATVTPGGELLLSLSDGYSVQVSGKDNQTTSAIPWWFGLVSDSSAGPTDSEL